MRWLSPKQLHQDSKGNPSLLRILEETTVFTDVGIFTSLAASSADSFNHTDKAIINVRIVTAAKGPSPLDTVSLVKFCQAQNNKIFTAQNVLVFVQRMRFLL